MRFFVVVDTSGTNHGRFKGHHPYTAAKKAANKVFRDKGKTSTGTIRITLRESTRGNGRKQYTYDATRMRKPNVKVRQLPDGTEFKNEFDIILKSVA